MSRRRIGLIASLVTLAVLGSSGGAVAAWNASSSVSAAASSATIATTMQQTGSLSTMYRYSGTSSTAAAGQLTITNTGGAPLTYSLANQLAGSTALAQKTTLRLWTGTCGTSAPAGAMTTTLANTAPALPQAARALAAGASVTVCISTQVEGTTNASVQGQSITATFSVVGAVGTSWTTSASAAAVTQSVYRLSAAGNPTCAPSSTRNVRLTWSAPANRTDNATLSYRVYDAASGTTVATVSSASATVSTDLSGNAIAANGTYQLLIEARESTASGTTAPASTAHVAVTRSTGILDIFQLFPRYDCS
jgi:hypothetical protein